MPTVHFETLGCKLNQIETESLARAFSEAGFGVESAAAEEVILAVVNTCTVTGKAEQKARHLIRSLLKRFPQAPVLVTGCYAELEAALLAGIDARVCVLPGSLKGQLADLPAQLAAAGVAANDGEVLKFLVSLNAIQNSARIPSPLNPLQPPAKIDPSDTFRLSTDSFLYHSRASIKIQDGCDNQCSYCRIRLARGKAVSLHDDEVLSRIRKIEAAGWAEVVLSGVNLSQYRSDRGNFAHLLERILSETEHIAVRISSLYPERINAEILPFLADRRIRPHFHLSVQSASDRILQAMRRPYRAETVYRAVEQLRSIRDDPFLACDIICGFPGETEADFEETLTLCRALDFAGIHAFPFSPRPGTEAFTLKPRVPERIAGERVAALTALAEEQLARYKKRWIGRTVQAIVEEGRAARSRTRALTENYLTVGLDGVSAPRGTQITVRIIDSEQAEFVKPSEKGYTKD